MFHDNERKKVRATAAAAQFLDSAEYEAEVFYDISGGLRVQCVGRRWKLVRIGFGKPTEPTSIWAEIRDGLEPVPWVSAAARRTAIRAAQSKVEGDFTQQKYVQLLNHLMKSRQQ